MPMKNLISCIGLVVILSVLTIISCKKNDQETIISWAKYTCNPVMLPDSSTSLDVL